MDYGSYQNLLFERHPNGVLLITMNRPEVYNAADEVMHGQLAKLWTDVARDDETRVAVITGAGKAFSALAAIWPWCSGWQATMSAPRTCSAR